MGRTQVQVRSAPQPIVRGRSLASQAILERLEALGYREAADRPQQPGAYAVQGDTLWIYRRAYRASGRKRRARLIELVSEGGAVTRALSQGGRELPLSHPKTSLEPAVLADSLHEVRSPRLRVAIQGLPEQAWRPLLALEDHRFFSHLGVSARGIARAARANTGEGSRVEGGSTLTQQLIKNRDLSPRRSMSRKASEAIRALALEARHDKETILQAYLNTVYYGHIEGVGVYGIEQAARTWLGKSATELSLAEGALLAAMVQAPNALNPIRHPQAARDRRDKALRRMLELGWASEQEITTALQAPLDLRPSPPPPPLGSRHLTSYARELAQEQASRRVRKDLGLQIETTIDPWIQSRAQSIVSEHLNTLRRGRAQLRDADLHAVALVMDARSGDLLVYVAGDPARPLDTFDRARRAQRQPGSTVKPLILMHALSDCEAQTVRPTTLIEDGPLRIDGWSPRNVDGQDRGPLSARDALISSRNLPFVRLTERCGRESAADTLRQHGLSVPRPAPASLPLGAIETSPLALLQAHSPFATAGRTVEPRLIPRLARPNGTRTGGELSQRRRVARPPESWLVQEALRAAVSEGTGKRAQIEGAEVAGKTGTSSGGRDAWFVGHVGDLVGLVWIGADRGAAGLSGGAHAAPLWASILSEVIATRPARSTRPPPRGVVKCQINPETGLAPGVLGDKSAEERWCLRRSRPKRNQPWRSDSADVIR